MGWSFGNSLCFSMLANASALPRETRELLEGHLRTVVIHGKPHLSSIPWWPEFGRAEPLDTALTKVSVSLQLSTLQGCDHSSSHPRREQQGSQPDITSLPQSLDRSANRNRPRANYSRYHRYSSILPLTERLSQAFPRSLQIILWHTENALLFFPRSSE